MLEHGKYNSCIRKQTLGEGSARRAARILQYKQGQTPEDVRPYPCRAHWHVGHVSMKLIVAQIAEDPPIPEPSNVVDLATINLETWAEQARQYC